MLRGVGRGDRRELGRHPRKAQCPVTTLSGRSCLIVRSRVRQRARARVRLCVDSTKLSFHPKRSAPARSWAGSATRAQTFMKAGIFLPAPANGRTLYNLHAIIATPRFADLPGESYRLERE